MSAIRQSTAPTLHDQAPLEQAQSMAEASRLASFENAMVRTSKGTAMFTLAKDFKAAFGSAWVLVGVLISAVAVFNWLSSVLKIGMSTVFARLSDAFRGLFHPVIEFVTGWATHWIPFVSTPEFKDGFVLWAALTGAVVRTLIRRSLPAFLERRAYLAEYPVHFVRSQWLVFLVFALLFFPVGLLLVFIEPIALSNRDGQITHTSSRNKAAAVDAGRYLYDVRITFLFQLVAIALVVCIFTLLNASGLL